MLCSIPLRRQSQHMKKRGFQRGNPQSAAALVARWGEREVRDAGVPASAPRAPYPPPSGALIAPSTQVRANRPLQLVLLLRTLQPQQSYHSQSGGNAEHPPLPTYVSRSLPVKATALLTHAPMRRAVTRAATALRCAVLQCAGRHCAALHCVCTTLALHRAAHWQLSPLSTPTATRAHAALWGRLVMRKRW